MTTFFEMLNVMTERGFEVTFKRGRFKDYLEVRIVKKPLECTATHNVRILNSARFKDHAEKYYIDKIVDLAESIDVELKNRNQTSDDG